MMDFDLRAKKLQQQADLRITEAKKKLANEQRLLREQKLREEKLAELAIIQKEKEEAEKLRLYEEEQLLLQKSGGILFSLKNLIPYQIDSEDDKIILPETCLLSLDQKNAFSHGHLCFELSCSVKPDNITHCGVREFSAEDGTVGLPIKVIHSLFGNHLATINDIGVIDLHYRKLNKIKSAKFAPHSNEFFTLYKHNIKHVLEENLKLHTCLSLGDILSVWYRGKSFFVTVTELLPENYGTLIDTDVEIDFTDYETHISSSSSSNTKINDTQTQQIQSSSSGNNTTTSNKTTKIDATSYPTNTSSHETADVNDNINIISDYDIEPEPDQPQPGVNDSHMIYCRIRIMMSNTSSANTNTTVTRRFVKFQTLKQLFYYLVQLTNIKIELLKVALPSSNRVFMIIEDGTLVNQTFEQLNFSKREIVIVTLN